MAKSCQSIIDFYGWFRNDNALYLAIGYMPLGDLEQNLRTESALDGLKIMHTAGFAHRDFKTANMIHHIILLV